MKTLRKKLSYSRILKFVMVAALVAMAMIQVAPVSANNEPVELTTTTVVQQGGTYTISTEAALRALSTQVGGGTTFKNSRVELTADIDLRNVNFPAIGNGTRSFLGTFDGNYHTISNLTVSGGTGSAGLFGIINPGATDNIEIKNFVIKGGSATAKLRGAVLGQYIGVSGAKIAIRNIEVADFEVRNITNSISGHTGGGIAGYIGGVSAADTLVENCIVTGNSEVYTRPGGYGTYVGGIVGTVANTTLNGCYSNGRIRHNATHGVGGGGPIIGTDNGGAVIKYCYYDGDVYGSSGDYALPTLNPAAYSNTSGTGKKSGQPANTVYLNTVAGNDALSGAAAASSVKTFERARELLNKNGTIVLTNSVNLSADRLIHLSGLGSASIKKNSGAETMFILNAGNYCINNIIVNGNALAQCIGVEVGAALRIESGAVITGGKSAIGGGIRVNGGSLLMSGGTISDCTATNVGGAVYVVRGSADFAGGTISNNTAANSGGAVAVNNGTVSLSGAVFSSNKVTGTGYCYGGTVAGTNGAVVNFTAGSIKNSEAMAGGAVFLGSDIGYTPVLTSTNIFAMSGSALIENCHSRNLNRAAVYLRAAEVQIYGGTFSKCKGGALFLNGCANSVLQDFTVSECSAGNKDGTYTELSGAGGGIHLEGTAGYTLTDVTIDKCYAASGGAIYTASPMTVNGGVIKNCVAVNGGAVYVYRGASDFTGAALSGNKADTGNGGGIYLAGGSIGIGEGTKISGNTAYNGGGIYMAAGTLNMTAGEISGNKADNGANGAFGGGIAISGGVADVSGGTIGADGTDGGNRAVYGGGVAVAKSGEFRLRGTAQIINNDGAFGAGAYIDPAGLTGSGASARFVMTGGKVTGNHNWRRCAGVMLKNGAVADISSGEITGNYSTGSLALVGGVYADATSTLNIKGDPIIRDNYYNYNTVTKTGSRCDVNLLHAKSFNITGPMTCPTADQVIDSLSDDLTDAQMNAEIDRQTSRIGIFINKAFYPQDQAIARFTYNNVPEGEDACFFSNQNYAFGQPATNLSILRLYQKVYISASQTAVNTYPVGLDDHKGTYTAKAQVYTVSDPVQETVAADQPGDSAGADENNVVTTYVLTDIADTDYLLEMRFYYYNTATRRWVQGFPVNAGKYTMRATLPTDNDLLYYSTYRNFYYTINKQQISVPVAARNQAGYIGSQMTPHSLLTNQSATVTYKWYKKVANVWQTTPFSTAAAYTPVNADKGCSFKAVMTGSGNYTGVEEIIYAGEKGVSFDLSASVPLPVPGGDGTYSVSPGVPLVFSYGTYKITVNAGAGGTVSQVMLDLEAEIYPKILGTAIPGTDYIFVGWDVSGGGVISSRTKPQATIYTTSNNYTVTAKFIKKQTTLTLNYNQTTGIWDAGTSSYKNIKASNTTVVKTYDADASGDLPGPSIWYGEFMGWYTQPGYTEGTKYTELGGTSGALADAAAFGGILYAHWKYDVSKCPVSMDIDTAGTYVNYDSLAQALSALRKYDMTSLPNFQGLPDHHITIIVHGTITETEAAVLSITNLAESSLVTITSFGGPHEVVGSGLAQLTAAMGYLRIEGITFTDYPVIAGQNASVFVKNATLQTRGSKHVLTVGAGDAILESGAVIKSVFDSSNIAGSAPVFVKKGRLSLYNAADIQGNIAVSKDNVLPALQFPLIFIDAVAGKYLSLTITDDSGAEVSASALTTDYKLANNTGVNVGFGRIRVSNAGMGVIKSGNVVYATQAGNIHVMRASVSEQELTYDYKTIADALIDAVAGESIYIVSHNGLFGSVYTEAAAVNLNKGVTVTSGLRLVTGDYNTIVTVAPSSGNNVNQIDLTHGSGLTVSAASVSFKDIKVTGLVQSPSYNTVLSGLAIFDKLKAGGLFTLDSLAAGSSLTFASYGRGSALAASPAGFAGYVRLGAKPDSKDYVVRHDGTKFVVDQVNTITFNNKSGAAAMYLETALIAASSESAGAVSLYYAPYSNTYKNDYALYSFTPYVSANTLPAGKYVVKGEIAAAGNYTAYEAFTTLTIIKNNTAAATISGHNGTFYTTNSQNCNTAITVSQPAVGSLEYIVPAHQFIRKADGVNIGYEMPANAEAGDYTVRFVFAETANFAGFTVSADFSILSAFTKFSDDNADILASGIKPAAPQTLDGFRAAVEKALSEFETLSDKTTNEAKAAKALLDAQNFYAQHSDILELDITGTTIADKAAVNAALAAYSSLSGDATAIAGMSGLKTSLDGKKAVLDAIDKAEAFRLEQVTKDALAVNPFGIRSTDIAAALAKVDAALNLYDSAAYTDNGTDALLAMQLQTEKAALDQLKTDMQAAQAFLATHALVLNKGTGSNGVDAGDRAALNAAALDFMALASGNPAAASMISDLADLLDAMEFRISHIDEIVNTATKDDLAAIIAAIDTYNFLSAGVQNELAFERDALIANYADAVRDQYSDALSDDDITADDYAKLAEAYKGMTVLPAEVKALLSGEIADVSQKFAEAFNDKFGALIAGPADKTELDAIDALYKEINSLPGELLTAVLAEAGMTETELIDAVADRYTEAYLDKYPVITAGNVTADDLGQIDLLLAAIGDLPPEVLANLDGGTAGSYAGMLADKKAAAEAEQDIRDNWSGYGKTLAQIVAGDKGDIEAAIDAIEALGDDVSAYLGDQLSALEEKLAKAHYLEDNNAIIVKPLTDITKDDISALETALADLATADPTLTAAAKLTLADLKAELEEKLAKAQYLEDNNGIIVKPLADITKDDIAALETALADLATADPTLTAAAKLTLADLKTELEEKLAKAVYLADNNAIIVKPLADITKDDIAALETALADLAAADPTLTAAAKATLADLKAELEEKLAKAEYLAANNAIIVKPLTDITKDDIAALEAALADLAAADPTLTAAAKATLADLKAELEEKLAKAEYLSDNNAIIVKPLADITKDDVSALETALADLATADPTLTAAAKLTLADLKIELEEKLAKAQYLEDNNAIIVKPLADITKDDISALETALADLATADPALTAAAKLTLADLKAELEEKLAKAQYLEDNNAIIVKPLADITKDDISALETALADLAAADPTLTAAAKLTLADLKIELEEKLAKAEYLAANNAIIVKPLADITKDDVAALETALADLATADPTLTAAAKLTLADLKIELEEKLAKAEYLAANNAIIVKPLADITKDDIAALETALADLATADPTLTAAAKATLAGLKIELEEKLAKAEYLAANNAIIVKPLADITKDDVSALEAALADLATADPTLTAAAKLTLADLKTELEEKLAKAQYLEDNNAIIVKPLADITKDDIAALETALADLAAADPTLTAAAKLTLADLKAELEEKLAKAQYLEDNNAIIVKPLADITKDDIAALETALADLATADPTLTPAAKAALADLKTELEEKLAKAEKDKKAYDDAEQFRAENAGAITGNAATKADIDNAIAAYETLSPEAKEKAAAEIKILKDKLSDMKTAEEGENKEYFSVEGRIKDAGGKPVENAAVGIYSGGKLIDSGHTDANGHIVFGGLVAGYYNVVVTKDGETVTTAAEIKDKNVVITANLKGIKKNTVVEVKDGAPAAAVGGLGDLFNDTSVYTADDAGKVAAGGSVDIKVTVSEKANESLIDKYAGKKHKSIGMMVDITVTKTVTTASGQAAVTSLRDLNTAIIVILPLSNDLIGKKAGDFTVYRLHNGVVQTITLGSGGEEYFELSDDGAYIMIHTKHFSSFAVAYNVNDCVAHWILLALICTYLIISAILAFIIKKRRSIAKAVVWCLFVAGIIVCAILSWWDILCIIFLIAAVIIALIAFIIWLLKGRDGQSSETNEPPAKEEKPVEPEENNVAVTVDAVKPWKLVRPDVLRHVEEMKKDQKQFPVEPNVRLRSGERAPDSLRTGVWSFAVMYEYAAKDGLIKFFGRMDEDCYKRLKKEHPAIEPSDFANTGDWYRVFIDETFVSEKQVMDMLDAWYAYVLKTCYVYDEKAKSYTTDDQSAKQAESEISKAVAAEAVAETGAVQPDEEEVAGAVIATARLGFTLSREDVLDRVDEMAEDTGRFPVTANTRLRLNEKAPDSLRAGVWTFAVMYVSKGGIIKFFVRMDQADYKRYKQDHAGIEPSKFADTGDWYKVIVDDTFRAKKEVMDMLDACYYYVLKHCYTFDPLTGKYTTDDQAAAQSETKTVSAIEKEIILKDEALRIAEDKKAELDAALLAGLRLDINKKILADHTVAQFETSSEVQRRADYTSTNLPLADTYYALAGISDKGVFKKVCYAYVYQFKNGGMKIIVKLPKDYAESLMQRHPNMCRSKFPAGKNWYVTAIDSTYESNAEIYSILARAKQFTEKPEERE